MENHWNSGRIAGDVSAKLKQGPAAGDWPAPRRLNGVSQAAPSRRSCSPGGVAGSRRSGYRAEQERWVGYLRLRVGSPYLLHTRLGHDAGQSDARGL